MLSTLFQARRSLGLCLGKGWSSLSKPFVKGMCEKEPEKTQKVHPQWDKLPRDIWGLIFQRLLLVDRIHASLVCKQWSSALKQSPPQPIWILLPPDNINDNNDCKHMISFFDLGEGAIGKLNLPKSISGATLIGASKGWLALTKGKKNSPQIFLLDPISGVQIPLPPLLTIRSTSEDTNAIDKIEISSRDASQCVVAACFDEGRILALCRPKDKRWIIFEGLGVADDHRYACILFCHGILYALITTEDDEVTFQFQTHSLKLAGDHDVILKLIPLTMFEISSPIFLEDPLEEVDTFGKNWAAIPYLVESNGDLLIVLKILDALITEDEDQDDDDEDNVEPIFSYCRIATFEVFKVEASDDTLWLTRLSNLDDQTLFIDGVDSLSLPGENFSKNCIYFLEDSFGYTAEGWKPIISRESGVFYLHDGRIERSLPSLDLSKLGKDFCYLWFFPNIKIGDFN
ncbi:PREDICTED: putative F-box protein At4g22660 [Theobroma cacao]|uniref:F-box protein At4g22660 n=1 Tax=Theobroma cacao TaxID=3641 RepID=A0AB32VIW9_THECC|nr:PREDICTED: putative F-box protein At4g22660 [Theobroma cacao]